MMKPNPTTRNPIGAMALAMLVLLLPPAGLPAQETLPVPPGHRLHVVERLETLGHLAGRYGTTVAAIQEANRLENPNRILEGQRLLIPMGSPARYTVLPGDSVSRILRRLAPGMTLDQFLVLNPQLGGDAGRIYPGQVLVLREGAQTAPPRSIRVPRPGRIPPPLPRPVIPELGRNLPASPGGDPGAGAKPHPALPMAQEPEIHLTKGGESAAQIASFHRIPLAVLRGANPALRGFADEASLPEAMSLAIPRRTPPPAPRSN